MKTRIKHEVMSRKKKIRALRGDKCPEAIGRFDFTLFFSSAWRSKYWFRMKILAVAKEKAKKIAMA